MTVVDPLVRQAAETAVRIGFISTETLRLRFNIGPQQADRIMTQLERYDIVGRSRNGQPREILATPDTLDRLLNQQM